MKGYKLGKIIPTEYFLDKIKIVLTDMLTSGHIGGTYIIYIQCMMQSYGNSFCGDVVLDSFNKAYRVEDNI